MTMHSLSANSGSSSPTENDRLRQDIPEEPTHFESMNYNVENPQTRTRAGICEEFMSLNMNYSSTAGSQQTSHGFRPRYPNYVPYNHQVYHPGIPGPAHPQRPFYLVDPNQFYYRQHPYQYPRVPVPSYQGQPPLLDSIYPYPPHFRYGPPSLQPPPPPPPPPQPPPYRMPASSLSVDHPASSANVARPLENTTQHIGSLDKYRFFFENERRGGGDIENFQHDEENNMLVITFKDSEARASIEVKSVRKGAKDDALLVAFNSPVDIPKLQTACNLKPFQTKAVTVFKVPATKVLIAEHVPVSIAPETISDYFETRKCGNDMQTEVVKVEGFGQDGCYLVHFADHRVVEQISSRVHTLGEESIKVHLHHKCIGRQSPEFTDATLFQMSGGVLVEGVHQLVPRFLRKSPKVLRNIQEKLSGYGLSLELNESNQVFVVRTAGSECESKAAGGIDVQGLARSVINEFVLQFSVPIPKELRDNVDTMVKQISVDETEAKMFTDKQVLAIVGIPSKANEIKGDVEKHLADRISSKILNKIVNEEVKSLTPLKVKFLRECGFNKGMKQFSGVSVRFDGNVINLSGPEASVKEAKIQLYELAHGTQTSVIEHISPQQLAVLQKMTVEDTVREEMKRAGIGASWHAKESSLEVISTSEENVRQFTEMLLRIVVERIVLLEGKMQLVMQSESWASLQKSLVDYLSDTFSIQNVQDKGYLLIAGLKDDVESVYAKVTEFLSSNTVKETCLKFPRGVHRFLLAHNKDAVATIAKDLKDCHVRIVYQENGAEFTINGSKEGIDQSRKETDLPC
ncbi:uncharacterized protein LOC124273815 [Haliotis rubra]|uniref:uncharacterized protein LOC124273815 n=1 Tax=Haliotis rubra TaxID=36100 RepID=UPI001EE529CB|nr:uncharacterized protein LOC124273815 [Haliotis rubra]